MVTLSHNQPQKQLTPSDMLSNDDHHEETTGTGYKRTYNYNQWRKQVTEALYLTGNDKEAALFGNCSEYPLRWIPSGSPALHPNAATVWTCSGDETHDAALFMPTCDLRICPDCAARQTARLAARYIPKAIELAMSGGAYGLRHIVFTTPLSLTSDAPDKISKKADAYAKLPRRALELVQALGVDAGRDWSTIGCIQSEEYGTDGLKLHFHVVQAGSYVPQKELAEAWQQVTDNQASVVFVRKIGNGSPDEVANDVIETLKYSVKFHKTDAETGEVEYIPPNVMPHLLAVLKGRRRIRTWGVFYRLPKPEDKAFLCQECKSEMVRVGVENWDLWLEYGATYEDVKAAGSSLNLILANKSDFARQNGNKSPPDKGSKQASVEQKPLPLMPDKDNWWHYEG